MVGKKRRMYIEDMLVVSMVVLLILGIWASADLPREPPEWFQYSYRLPEEFEYPEEPPSDTEPEIREESVLADSGYLTEGATTEIVFEITYEKLIELQITLQWTDDIGSNDEFELSIAYEDESPEGNSGTSGSIEITIRGGSPGNYTATITAVDCPGIVGPFPVDRDNGNDWELEVTATYEVIP
jgi:hypothetical protein